MTKSTLINQIFEKKMKRQTDLLKWVAQQKTQYSNTYTHKHTHQQGNGSNYILCVFVSPFTQTNRKIRFISVSLCRLLCSPVRHHQVFKAFTQREDESVVIRQMRFRFTSLLKKLLCLPFQPLSLLLLSPSFFFLLHFLSIFILHLSIQFSYSFIRWIFITFDALNFNPRINRFFSFLFLTLFQPIKSEIAYLSYNKSLEKKKKKEKKWLISIDSPWFVINWIASHSKFLSFPTLIICNERQHKWILMTPIYRNEIRIDFYMDIHFFFRFGIHSMPKKVQRKRINDDC